MALFFGELIHKEGRECFQFFLLLQIDIEAFVVQPLIGIDSNIAAAVGINDKGIGGVLVAVCLVNFIPAVTDGASAAGKIRHGGENHNGLSILVPPYNEVADFGFAAVDKAIIEAAHIFGVAHNEPVGAAVFYGLAKQLAYLLPVRIAFFMSGCGP